MLIVAVIIAVALLRVVVQVSQLMVFGAINPMHPQEFERIFGMLMTLLIALEFNHSIHAIVDRQHRIVQVKTVVLISILALLRRFHRPRPRRRVVRGDRRGHGIGRARPGYRLLAHARARRSPRRRQRQDITAE